MLKNVLLSGIFGLSLATVAWAMSNSPAHKAACGCCANCCATCPYCQANGCDDCGCQCCENCPDCGCCESGSCCK